MSERQKSSGHKIAAGAARGWTAGAFVSLAVLTIAIAMGGGACSSKGGYACGEGTPNNGNEVRRCDGTDEACICATQSCARKTYAMEKVGNATGGGCPDGREPNDGKVCDSGYRYLNAPFADETWAGCCVAPIHANPETIVANDAKSGLCPGALALPDAGEDGGSSSSSSSGSSSSTSGNSSSGSGGAGGAGGNGGTGGNGTAGAGGT